MSVNSTQRKAATPPQPTIDPAKTQEAAKPVVAPPAASAVEGKEAATKDGFVATAKRAFSAGASKALAAPDGELKRSTGGRERAASAELSDFRNFAGIARPADRAPRQAAAPDAGLSTQAAGPTSESHAPVGNLDQKVLDQMIKGGKVEAKDFERMDPEQKATTIASMSQPASTNINKRDNLMRLMQDPSFSTHLTAALNQMEPAQRLQFIKTVGEKTTGSNAGSKEASKIEHTLHDALSNKDMVESRRNQMLVDALKSGDTGSIAAVKSLLETSASSAVSLVESVASTPDLGPVLSALGPAGKDSALGTALSWVAGCSDEGKVRELFQNVAQGDPKVREMFEKQLGELRPEERRSLFCKVMTDPSGSQPGQPPNAGQRLLANYFDNKGADEVKQLLDGVADLPDREGKRVPYENFIRNNVTNPDALRAADTPKAKEGEWAHLGKMDREEVGKLIQSKSSTSGVDFTNFDYQNPDRLKMIDSVADHGGPGAKAMLTAGIADSMLKDNPSADEKKAARAQMVKLLKTDPNAVLREMSTDDVKTMIKSFLQPPADMKGLREIMPDLNGHSAAKFAQSLKLASSSIAADVNAGGWGGDLLKSIEVGAETTVNGVKGSLKFSPGKLIDGAKGDDLMQIQDELNSFIVNWTRDLNKMPASQKDIFKREMGPEITVSA